MRVPTRAALGALLLGIVAALAAGEGLVRLAAWWSPAVRDLAVSPRPTRRAHLRLPGGISRVTAHAGRPPPQLVQLLEQRPRPERRGVRGPEAHRAVPHPGARGLVHVRTRSLSAHRHDPLGVARARGLSGPGSRPAQLRDRRDRGRDYRAIVTLGLRTYDPDLVLVNFYAGNDGPDLYREAHERSRGPNLLGASRLWTFGRNALRLWRGVHDLDAVQAPPAGPAPPGQTPRGGTPVDPSRHVSERDPALTGPIFTEAAFAAIQAAELRRLYRPEDPAIVDRAWQPVLADLEAIRAEVLRQGRGLALAVYPSALQVYPGAAGRPGRDAATPPAIRRALGRRARPVAPQPAARRLLPARGPPVRRSHAGLRRGEPRVGGAALQATGRALDAPGQPGRGRGRSPVPGRPGVPRRSAGAERCRPLTAVRRRPEPIRRRRRRRPMSSRMASKTS